jgi:hypothetical protein
MNLLTISNSGADIAATTYWDTEHASAGICYLTANAGTWRLLVPEAAEGTLADMRTGTCATIEPSLAQPQACWDVVFEDGTDSPFCLSVDRRQVDRKMEPGSCRLAVWTQRGKQLDIPCTVRT